MERSLKRKVVAGTIAGLAVAGGGGAIAATQFGGSPGEESQAIVNDAAQQLGIQPSKLSDALKTALKHRVDAAVTAGRLTKEQGDEIKERIDSGDFPIFGGPHEGRGHFGHFADLDAAATYLGLTEAGLRTQLEGGKTLAQIAQDRGKSVDGLISALVDSAKKKLDAAVAAGKLTQGEEDSILADLKQRITDLVNGKMPSKPPAFGFRRFGGDHIGSGHFDGPPPGFELPAA
jgi:hypothetical protein